MRRPVSSLAVAMFTTLVATAPAVAQQTTDRYESNVVAFETADKTSPPPKGEIVFVGSSTIQRWDTARYFPDLKIINRGISGSELVDALRYVDRIVLPYQPRLIVVYAGDNDISGGWISEQVAVTFEKFTRAVHAKLPQTRILFIAIKPSILRWTQIDRMRSTNAIIRAYCERDDRLAFIDFDTLMLGFDERPRRELFVEDGLHLSPQGYQLWTNAIRPLLNGLEATEAKR
jgi:lysophospholipase L1-like esterase